MEQKNLHEIIVRKILPSFAEKLKKEAVISSYDRNPFTISLLEDRPPIKIILGYYKRIAKVIIFVLHDQKQQKIHDRGFDQKIMLSQIFGKLTPTVMASWNPDETTAYHNLRYILRRFVNGE